MTARHGTSPERTGKISCMSARAISLPGQQGIRTPTFVRRNGTSGRNRVAFEEWKVTLPHELSHRQNMALMRDLVDAIAGTRLPITYAFHDPTTLGYAPATAPASAHLGAAK